MQRRPIIRQNTTVKTLQVSTQPRRRGLRKKQSAVTFVPHNATNGVVSTPNMPLFPARSKMMMLPYYSSGSLSFPATSAAVGYVFSLNGLYDPDITGTGGQPMGFDQMMVFYEHYTVYRTEVFVTFRNGSTTTSPNVALAIRADVTLSSDGYLIMENGNSISTKLLPGPNTNSMQQFHAVVDTAKFLGVDDLQDFESGRGTISDNPAEGLFAHLYAANLEQLNSGLLYFDIRIEYHAVFSEPRIITRSLAKNLHRVIMDETKSQPKPSHCCTR